MTNPNTIAQLKEEIIIIYMRYFGSVMAESYKKFYADKDIKTTFLSAEELLSEYAGETKGKDMIEQLKRKYAISNL
jgi:hypothetical protein